MLKHLDIINEIWYKAVIISALFQGGNTSTVRMVSNCHSGFPRYIILNHGFESQHKPYITMYFYQFHEAYSGGIFNSILKADICRYFIS